MDERTEFDYGLCGQGTAMSDPFAGLSEAERKIVQMIAEALSVGPLLPHNRTHPLMARRVFNRLQQTGLLTN